MNTTITVPNSVSRVGDEIRLSPDRKVPLRALPTDLKAHSVKLWLDDLGPWFLFFFAIYIILMLKLMTFHSLYDHVFFGFYSILIATYILSRFILAYFKKDVYYDVRYQPSVSFVVPAKNEESNIAETIRRFGEVDYPMEKIEAVIIDDGSTDGTLAQMQLAGAELSKKIGRVDVVHWEKNRGKRHGMAEGSKLARNEIIIFVDSDSFVEPDCIKHLVKYFADPHVGAVSAHTDVYNRDENLLTRMQAIRYYISFKVYKAAESVFGTVTCCPGCCSAYRRAYLMEFVEEWLHQKFLGSECTFGDDRSLTNYMIRKYRAVYSEAAKAFTVVPNNFKVYMRQQQRWKKSWVRETFIASSFMWRKNPVAAISFYAYVFLAFISPIVFFRAIFLYPIVEHQWPLVYLFGLFLMLLIHGVYYRVNTGRKNWILAICNFWFNTVILIWQLPWAVVTLKDSRWGTR